MKSLLSLCKPIVLFAALNCGLSAIGYDLVGMVFSGDAVRIINIIFGLSALLILIGVAKK